MARPGYMFLVCPDPELCKDQVRMRIAQEPSFAAKIFWGDEELSSRYWQALTMQSLMGPRNAVVLRKANEQKEEFWTQIEPILARPRTSVWPLFCLEGEWKSDKPNLSKTLTKHPYWTIAQENDWVWTHPGLSRATLGTELQSFAQRYGLSFAPGIQKKLAESLPVSTIALRNELEKIRLLAGNATEITAEHLAALTEDTPFDIFVFLRQVHNPATRPTVWSHVIHDPALANGDMVFALLALLMREARQLWHLAHGEADKVNLYPSLKNEKMRLAQRLGPKRLSLFWDIVIKAETDIKTGRLKPAQVQDALVRDIQRLW